MKKTTVPKRILVINDTQEILELFSDILHEEMGFEVVLDSYKPHMLDIIKQVNPDLIISDHVFGEEKIAWQLLQRLKMDRDTAQIPVIICSAAIKDLKEMEGYLTSKDVGVLYKPFEVDELINLVNEKLKEARDPTLHHGSELK
ncbi:MAG TPA: response regulator [Chloroflexia bacterium]|nr:response regulator [Chloroflexia bacterium]